MPTRTSSRRTGRSDAYTRYVVSLTAAAGLGVTLLLNAVPELQPFYEKRRLHVALETSSSFALLFVATMMATRLRRIGSLVQVLELAAIVVLLVEAVAFSVLVTILISYAGGFVTWASTGATLLGAGLLAASGFVSDRPTRSPRRALLLTLLGAAGGLAAITILAGLFEDVLPAAFEDPPSDRESLEDFYAPALTVFEALIAVCFGAAAAGFARKADESGLALHRWLAVGSVIAAIAYLNYALVPSLYTELIYGGDLFFALAVIAFVVAAMREIGAYHVALTDSAILEERRRVARDLHDGVAQELSFIASRMHSLAKDSPPERPVAQIIHAVERALDESREAISTLNRPLYEPLQVTLAGTAEDVASRFGARVVLDLDEDIDVPTEWREALPRLVREAVTNSVRHGQARIVTVALREADGVWLRVSDDGEGFDPSEPPPPGSFGLVGMKERAEALGGQFRLSSEPGAGTTVEIMLP